MIIYFTIEASIEVIEKIGVIDDYTERIESFFKDRYYSSDLEYLYVGLFCMSPEFEPVFTPRKPKYTAATKEYLHKGVILEKKAKTYEYELRLDFEKYNELKDVRSSLAKDIINSLDVLLTCKKIKNLDLTKFKEDFRQLFKEINWLDD